MVGVEEAGGRETFARSCETVTDQLNKRRELHDDLISTWALMTNVDDLPALRIGEHQLALEY